mgnify:CR=1 FL=1
MAPPVHKGVDISTLTFADGNVQTDDRHLQAVTTISSNDEESQPTNSPPQKTNKLEPYLPYYDKVVRSRECFLGQLKARLAEAVLKQGDALKEWISAFEE